ncbi:hypothetical protein OROMI_032129 [Orobanche minor]
MRDNNSCKLVSSSPSSIQAPGSAITSFRFDSRQKRRGMVLKPAEHGGFSGDGRESGGEEMRIARARRGRWQRRGLLRVWTGTQVWKLNAWKWFAEVIVWLLNST